MADRDLPFQNPLQPPGGASRRELWNNPLRSDTRYVQTLGAGAGKHDLVANAEEERGTLTVTVAREEAWLFERARTSVRHVAGATLEDTLEALVAEGTTALLPEVPRERLASLADSSAELAHRLPQRDWEAQLAAWREEAEARCEPKVVALTLRGGAATGESQAGPSARTTNDVVNTADANVVADPATLDTELRRRAAELARSKTMSSATKRRDSLRSLPGERPKKHGSNALAGVRSDICENSARSRRRRTWSGRLAEMRTPSCTAGRGRREQPHSTVTSKSSFVRSFSTR